MAKPSIVIGDGKFATKDTKFLAHAQGDSSSRFVARELTYDRGSNVTATRVLPNGLIEKGRENLFTHSNTFSNDSSWSKNNLSVSASGDAFDVTDDASTGSHYLFFSGTTPNSKVLTASIEAKAGSVNFLVIRLGGFNYAFFNVSNGTLANIPAAYIDAKIEATSDGFYRCSVSIQTPASGSASVFFPTDNSSSVSYTGTNSVALTVKNAQLELGLAATTYIESGASTGKAGILEDQARVDYLSNSNGYLLLEPTRQNKQALSENFSAYNATRASVTANADTSPEGLKNAAKLVEDITAGNTHKMVPPASDPFTSGTTYSISVFAKAAGRTQFKLQAGTTAVAPYNAVFNLTGESSPTAPTNNDEGTASMEYYGNGWYRCKIEGFEADQSASTTPNFFLQSSGNASYDGDGTSGILFYGFQLEEGSFATSYIPTHGAAASRAAEGLPASTGSVIDMSSFMKGDDVTLVVELAENSSTVRDASNASIRLSNGNSQSGSINIYRASASASTYRAVFFGTSPDSFSSGVSSGAVIIDGSAPKIAISRDRSAGTFTIYVNGSALANSDGLTDSNGQFTNSNFDVTMDDLQITGVGSILKLSKLKLFDSVLTNSGDNNEMASETT
jgi:hypothetical protein